MLYFRNFVANIIVLCVGYIGMLILKYIDVSLGIPTFQPLITVGIIVIALGVLLRIWASISFSKQKVEILSFGLREPPQLVVSGPYKYSRNPLYVGILLITLGFVLISGSVTGICFTFLFFLFWNALLQKKEEPYLLKKFGDEYKSYLLKVNRWI